MGAIKLRDLADGLTVAVKKDCPTCAMVEGVIRQLADCGSIVTVISQDDPSFPSSVAGVVDDRQLERSYRLGIETVPTLIRVAAGQEVGRTEGWNRGEWKLCPVSQDWVRDCRNTGPAAVRSMQHPVWLGDWQFSSMTLGLPRGR